MSGWIKPEVYAYDAEFLDDVGDSMHINHEDCPMGLDTKKRLYITRKEEGLVAYCQHCKSKGFLPTNKLTRHIKSHTVEIPTHNKICRGPAPIHLGDPLHAAGQMLLHMNNVSYRVIESYGCTYVEKDKPCGSFILPIRDCWDQKDKSVPIDAEVHRRIVPIKGVPKSVNKLYNGVRNKIIWKHIVDDKSDTVYIVEDIFSAIRLVNEGYNAVALLGTSLSNIDLIDIINKFDHVVLWLDGDKAGRDGTAVLAKQLANFVNVRIIRTDKDPKNVDNVVKVIEGR